MLSGYFLGLLIAIAFCGILALCKLRIVAMMLVAGYNLWWFGAVFASGNGFAFGYEPEKIETLDGYVLIFFTLSFVVVMVTMAIVDEIKTRRKLPKPPKKDAPRPNGKKK